MQWKNWIKRSARHGINHSAMRNKQVTAGYIVSALMSAIFLILIITFAATNKTHGAPTRDGVVPSNTTITTTTEPRQCSTKRIFRVLFSHLITVCLDLHDRMVYLGINYYSDGEPCVWFKLDEWKNFLHQLNLVKIVISDFQKKHP